MPTYEYLCHTCSHRFETWQKMTDDPLEICPECGGHIRRVYYPAGIVFKGSGFYKTDHRSSSNGANANGHSSSKEDTATGTDTAATTSETKTSGESKATSTETSSKSSPPSENKVAASSK
jgi:putative FmdB family regulatory protein